MTKTLYEIADHLAQIAVDLKGYAHANRPLPKKWKVGMKVRFIRSIDHGPSKGAILKITKLDTDKERRNRSANQYQVFMTGLLNPSENWDPTYWTTPDDVELVTDD